MNILVIEDDPSARMILRKRIQSFNHTYWEAENGQDGLELAGKQHPDLIISDWMMPVMDGVELCRRIKSDEELQAIYIILLTAKNQLADRIVALEAGADEFLTKPVESGELLARLRVGERILGYQRILRQMAIIDALTQARNRHAFYQDLDRMLATARRHARCSALLLTDVNAFKKINDTLGHDTGDRVLQAVAESLKQAPRKEDVVYRLGGDEFAVLFSEITDPDQLPFETIVGRVDSALEKHSIDGMSERITLSYGIAYYCPTADTTAEELYHQADQHLYERKRASALTSGKR